MLNDVSFLRKTRIVGSLQSQIFKKYGTKSAITDFAILLGGAVSDSDYTLDGQSLRNRTGMWWTSTPTSERNPYVINYDGHAIEVESVYRFVGGRPSLPYSAIKDNCFNQRINDYGLLEVEYGEYPMWLAKEEISIQLEKFFQKKTLTPTGKIYTTDSQDWKDIHDLGFVSRNHIEYEFQGQKYIRLVENFNEMAFEENGTILSNGNPIKIGETYWISVAPIQWLINEQEDIAITKNIVFSGVQFNIENEYYRGYFLYTAIKRFMDDYWSKEIDPNYRSFKEKSKLTSWDLASELWYTYMESDWLWKEIDEELAKTRTAEQRKSRPKICVSDVLTGNYTTDIFQMSDANKLITAMKLSSASEEYFEPIREFMKKLGPKACTAFELMWTHGDEKLFEYVLQVNTKEHNQKVRRKILQK